MLSDAVLSARLRAIPPKSSFRSWLLAEKCVYPEDSERDSPSGMHVSPKRKQAKREYARASHQSSSQ